MKKQVNFQLEESIHIASKKRIADLKVSFSDYVAALIQCELKAKMFDDRFVLQKFIDRTLWKDK